MKYYQTAVSLHPFSMTLYLTELASNCPSVFKPPVAQQMTLRSREDYAGIGIFVKFGETWTNILLNLKLWVSRRYVVYGVRNVSNFFMLDFMKNLTLVCA